jgi:hypothetical protein
MKTVEEMQTAIDAIRTVCKQHGIALLGVCYDEGIHGEIEISDATELAESDVVRLTNKAELMGGTAIYTEGIGDASNA